MGVFYFIGEVIETHGPFRIALESRYDFVVDFFVGKFYLLLGESLILKFLDSSKKEEFVQKFDFSHIMSILRRSVSDQLLLSQAVLDERGEVFSLLLNHLNSHILLLSD